MTRQMTPDELSAVDTLRDVMKSPDDVRLVLVRTFGMGYGVQIEHRPIEARPRWRRLMIDKGRPLPLLFPADGETVADVLHNVGTMLTLRGDQ